MIYNFKMKKKQENYYFMLIGYFSFVFQIFQNREIFLSNIKSFLTQK